MCACLPAPISPDSFIHWSSKNSTCPDEDICGPRLSTGSLFPSSTAQVFSFGMTTSAVELKCVRWPPVISKAGTR